MAKIKVLHLITKLELGGAQVNTVHTYENLDTEHFEAYLASGNGGILTGRVTKKDRFFILNNLVRPIHPTKDLTALFRLVRLFRRIKPDIVHTHSSKAGILGRLAAFLARVPVVIHTVHGFSFSPHQSFLKRSFYVTAEKLVAPLTGHVIFVSAEDRDVARQKKLVKENHSLIRSGFPFKKFLDQNTDKASLRARFNVGEGDFVCGIIAPFKPQKGLFHLVEIAARVVARNPAALFVIAGDGALRDELEARLKEKNILHRFRLPGFVFDVENIVDIFDLGVSTALWEGLPQSLVQLRLKKKALVASDIPGNREVVRDGGNGFLVNLFDYDHFADKILYHMENPDERERMAAFDDEDFSPWDADAMVREQESLYRRLVQ